MRKFLSSEVVKCNRGSANIFALIGFEGNVIVLKDETHEYGSGAKIVDFNNNDWMESSWKEVMPFLVGN